MWQAVAFRGAVDRGDLDEVNEMLLDEFRV